MKALEIVAREDLAAGGISEYVAIGFIEPGTDIDEAGPEVHWYAFDNEHPRDEDGRQTEFHVSGEQLQAVMEDVVARGDGAEEWDRVLWHSHPLSLEPSEEDIRDFPAGLCQWGLVYHAPSGVTTLYNQSGIVSPPTPSIDTALTTG